MLLSQVTPPVLVVYASQQGNSKAIAEDLCEECSNHDISASVTCISSLGKDPSILLNQACIVFIAATTGDGEPPDTARKFWRILNKSFSIPPPPPHQPSLPPSSKAGPQIQQTNEAELTRTPTDELKTAKENPPASDSQSLDVNLAASNNQKYLQRVHSKKESATLEASSQISPATPQAFKDKNFCEVSYTVLGLGDTNYTNFCNFGKNLDERLHKLGAKRFYSCGWADDGTGLELVIEPWLEGLWDALSARLSLITSQQPLLDADHKQRNGCGDDTVDNRVVEDSDGCSPQVENLKEDKEVRNNAVVNRIEKMNGDTAILITGEKGNIIELGVGSCAASNVSNSTVAKNEEDVLTDELSQEVAKLSVSDGLNKGFCFSIDNAWKENHELLQSEFPSDSKLTIPKIPAYGNIILDYDENGLGSDSSKHVYQNGASLPSAASPVYECDVVVFRKLSEVDPGKEVKKVVEVVAQLPSDCTFDYEPGDSLALLVRNDAQEVDLAMDLLGIPTPDQAFTLSKAPSSKRPLPLHLLPHCTAREIFTSCVDYKCLPKKAMLLLLLDSATDPHEKRCLQELVSREGADLYKKKVLGNRLTFFDVLTAFSSCRPKLTSLLEVLPRLIPRAYSLTSSPLDTQRRISFAYSLTVIPATPHVFRERYGVCTGLLDSLTEQICQDISSEVPVSPRAQLPLYLRNSKSFRLPEDPSIPIILIGPGCGVAPLVGFLRHRKLQIASNQLDVEQLGSSWLFFGCRYVRADELFRDELEEFHRSGILTHLRKCFSRELHNDEGASGPAARYVQDSVRAESEALSSAIAEREARVYVCGDAANMAKDVLATFGELMAERLGDANIGVQYVAQMQKDGRYLQDVWT